MTLLPCTSPSFAALNCRMRSLSSSPSSPGRVSQSLAVERARHWVASIQCTTPAPAGSTLRPADEPAQSTLPSARAGTDGAGGGSVKVLVTGATGTIGANVREATRRRRLRRSCSGPPGERRLHRIGGLPLEIGATDLRDRVARAPGGRCGCGAPPCSSGSPDRRRRWLPGHEHRGDGGAFRGRRFSLSAAHPLRVRGALRCSTPRRGSGRALRERAIRRSAAQRPASKLAGEALAHSYFRAHGVPRGP